MTEVDRKTIVATKACIAGVYVNPRYAELRSRLHLNPDTTPSLAELSDSDSPTTADVEAIFAAHEDLQKCRQIAIEGATQIDQRYVALLVENFRRTDEIMLGLVQGELTWGGANQKIEELQAWGKQEQAKLSAEIASTLELSHEQELAQRARISSALQQWSFQQQLLSNQRDAIGAMNRPHTLNCRYVGPTVSCTSF